VSETIRLQLRVSPGSARAAVIGRHGSAWKVRVAAAPEHGRANDELLALLARTLELPRRDVAIAVGHGARDKVVTLTGTTRGEVERRLGAAAVRPFGGTR
jgi:uncharacterized protein (TIGR00251 family)